MLKTTQYRLLIALNGSMMLLALLCLIEEYGFKTLPLHNWVLHLLQMISVIVLLITRYYLWSISKERRWKHLLPDIILLVVQILALLFLPQMLREVAPPSRIFWSLFHVFLLAMVVLRVARYTVTVASGRSPTRVLFGSFTFVIFTGAILLMLPAAHRGETISFTDAVFTATSATCVTGLTVLDTAGGFTHLGQTIILFLIQIGGLGIMIFGTLFAFVLGNPLTLRESVAMKDILNEQAPGRITRLVVFICFSTFLIELLGFCGLLDMWDSPLPLADRIYKSMFHAISAFCNAGFALQPDSLIPYRSSFQVYTVICPLVVLGGLGFPVLFNLFDVMGSRLKKLFRPGTRRRAENITLTLHSKIVLITTVVLIAAGWLLLTLLELNRPDGSSVSIWQACRDSLFNSITSRTAGFNTVVIAQLSAGAKMLMIFLMYIGGSPSSTAGGIKTITVAIMTLAIYSTIRRREQVHAFHRTIPVNIVRRAAILLTVYSLLIWFFTLLLTLTEKSLGADLLDLLFEVTSALGTVGLSTGVTAHLTWAGKWIIIVAMFIGRLGPLSLLAALTFNYRNIRYEYPSEPLVVG
ncbi:MAG: Ktr system potassium uptake protein B [Planctomycetes bacterium ADurb.Bin412]|nr:MAG: Ktr system potassium uptake protein B [Planctomycetes bacterium ADurb.Bin412]